MSSIYGWNNEGTGRPVAGGELSFVMEKVLGKSGYDYFTYMEIFSAYPKRQRGEYNLRSAKAILEISTSPNCSMYNLSIKFKSLSDIIELRNLILSGKVWPDICYDDPQVPAPCRHIKGLLKEMFDIVRREVAQKLHFA